MRLRSATAITCAALGIASVCPLAEETPAATTRLLLAEGTPVSLRMAQDISSRAARPGEPVELKLAEDLKVGDVVVAKAGARLAKWSKPKSRTSGEKRVRSACECTSCAWAIRRLKSRVPSARLAPVM